MAGASSRSLVLKLKSEGPIDQVLWVGIGGSSLGSSALIRGLSLRAAQSPRFHFLESPDIFQWTELKKHLKPERTLIVYVSKSGETFETLAWRRMLGEWHAGRARTVVLTDPVDGALRAWVTREHIPSLPIASEVGGRFSVWTPVGSFAMELAGLNAKDFFDSSCAFLKHREEWIPYVKLAETLCRSPESVHVLMPYSESLRGFTEWWVQLWAESLGKAGKGFFPIAAMGPQDQHSMLQLLLDGPRQAVTGFITVRPSTGHFAEELVQVEFESTRQALLHAGRGNSFHIEIPAIDESSWGRLMTAWALMTAYAGTALGIDPLNQPAVAAIKNEIRARLPAPSMARLANFDTDT